MQHTMCRCIRISPRCMSGRVLQLGIYTLSIISQSCAEQLCPHLTTLLSLFGVLLGTPSPAIHYYVIVSMTNLTPSVGSDQLVSRGRTPMVGRDGQGAPGHWDCSLLSLL